MTSSTVRFALTAFSHVVHNRLCEDEVSIGEALIILKWFALRVRSNFEKTTGAFLEGCGYELFGPTYTMRRRWSDRVKEVQVPLFPGYIFCRFDPANRLPVLKAPGLVHIVGAGREPEPVSESEIDSVRTLVNCELAVRPCPFLREGQFVRIEYGPLAGAEGILVAFKKGYRLVVSISILGRSVWSEVDIDWVRPLQRNSRQPRTD